MPHPPAGDSEDLRFAVLFLRAFGKLDRSELAAASGVSRNLIGAYEAGDKTPSWPTLERLAAAVGYPAALLEPMLSFIRLFRMAWEQGPWPLDRPVTIGPEPDLLFEGAIRAAGMLHLARLTRSQEDDPEETRRAARDAFSRLMTLPAALRRRALPVAKGLHTRAGAEILSAERDRAAAHDPDLARELGELALLAAEQSGPRDWQSSAA